MRVTEEKIEKRLIVCTVNCVQCRCRCTACEWWMNARHNRRIVAARIRREDWNDAVRKVKAGDGAGGRNKALDYNYDYITITVLDSTRLVYCMLVSVSVSVSVTVSVTVPVPVTSSSTMHISSTRRPFRVRRRPSSRARRSSRAHLRSMTVDRFLCRSTAHRKNTQCYAIKRDAKSIGVHYSSSFIFFNQKW